MKTKILLFLSVAALLAASVSPLGATGRGHLNGNMPAYYDGQLFTMNFMELPADAEASAIAHNKGINTIYQADECMPEGKMFTSVLDAIQGDGFNPLWLEVQITFNSGHPCRQLTSDTEVEAAVASGEITLTPTDEVYRCAVIGKKK